MSFSEAPNCIAERLPENPAPDIFVQTGDVSAFVILNNLPLLVPTNNFVELVVNGDTFITVASVSKSALVKGNLKAVVVMLVNLLIAPDLTPASVEAPFCIECLNCHLNLLD